MWAWHKRINGGMNSIHNPYEGMLNLNMSSYIGTLNMFSILVVVVVVFFFLRVNDGDRIRVQKFIFYL